MVSGYTFQQTMMDQIHNPSQRVTERYLLGEMTEDERLQFEEHYFSCEQCAQDVMAGATFLDTARELLPEMQREAILQRSWTSWFSQWCSWSLVPQFSMAALLLLSGVVGYQNLVQIPRLQTIAAKGASPLALLTGELSTATRSATGEVFSRKSGKVSIFFKNEWETSYPEYQGELQREGKLVGSTPVISSKGDLTSVVDLDKLQPGKYVITLYGISERSLKQRVAQHSFTVEN